MLEDQDTTDPHTARKRQPNAANRTAREATRLVQETNGRIAQWQVQLARHSANAERLTRRHEETLALRAALDALAAEVHEERKRLDALIASAEGSVAANTRVQDSQRALMLITARLKTLQALLPREPMA